MVGPGRYRSLYRPDPSAIRTLSKQLGCESFRSFGEKAAMKMPAQDQKSTLWEG